MVVRPSLFHLPVPGPVAMTDACKRRMIDDGWDKVDHEPEVQKPTEDDLKLKSMEKNFAPKDVWALEIYSDLDDSGGCARRIQRCLSVGQSLH